MSRAALQVPRPVREDPAVLTAAYDELPDGLLVVSSAGEVLALNRAGARLLGVEPEQAVGRHVCHVLGLSDERGHDWWAASARLRAMPGVTRSPEQRLVLALPAGEREVLATCRYVREAGRLVRLVVAFRDTEARERAERSRADLVSTVAHELRSPLTSVKGFTATLLAKWDRFTDEQKKIMLETVNADADRVTRLISELLDVSRIDSGRLELHRQVVDLGAAVRRVFAGRVASGEPAERFRLQVDGELPEMWLDPDKMDQVLENLVENALRHGAGTITVRVHGTGAGAEVTVTDEGEGIPSELRTRIFAKFWRGQPRRGGTGLGLYITRGIVEAHGGSITAGQAGGGGAQFRFFLPAGTPAFA